MVVGLYLSRCRGRVSEVLDLDALEKRFADQAEILRVVDDFFDTEVQEMIARDIAEAGMEAIVLAGNSPDHYSRSLSGPYLKQRIMSAGISPSRVIFANLLEQVAMPHAGDPDGAAAKAEAVVGTALLNARSSVSADFVTIEPIRSALVLGATPSGLVAAQRLLRLGWDVVVADRGEGKSREARGHRMDATASFVAGHPQATFVDNASLVDGAGWLGDYDVVLATGDQQLSFKVGGILLAEPEDTAWVEELRQHFRVDVDCDGRARSVDPSAHASETVDPGLVIVPEFGEGEEAMRESIAAADSAAMALVLRLSQPTIVHYADTSVVDETLCGGCASCVKTCAFGACSIDPVTKLSHVDPRRCQGCGKCVVSCPVGARDIINSPHDYLVNAIRYLADVAVSGQRVLGFLCGGCGYPAADRAGENAADGQGTYPASFLPLRIPCGGRLDTLYVLEAFKLGFDGVVIYQCEQGSCRNLIGNVDMERRMSLLRTVLRSRDLDDDRLRVVEVCPDKGHAFTDSVNAFMADLAEPAEAKGGVL